MLGEINMTVDNLCWWSVEESCVDGLLQRWTEKQEVAWCFMVLKMENRSNGMDFETLFLPVSRVGIICGCCCVLCVVCCMLHLMWSTGLFKIWDPGKFTPNHKPVWDMNNNMQSDMAVCKPQASKWGVQNGKQLWTVGLATWTWELAAITSKAAPIRVQHLVGRRWKRCSPTLFLPHHTVAHPQQGSRTRPLKYCLLGRLFRRSISLQSF
jgi:hypothetical protein